MCITCSGIHREFTHRVKSVSMAKFTTQEVEALQKGGNQRAREMYLSDWDPQQMRLPSSSNVDKIREFIKNVYVSKKYAGGKSSDKPPRDAQSLKNHEDHRRASSYHSFSQSPPYEHQYEDRLYGKQTGLLSRKPGSDHGRYEGKMSSFVYSSPGRQGEQLYEDKFANEVGGSRISDFSVSSTGDPFRSDVKSPNFQDSSNSPQQVRNILIEAAGPGTFNTHAGVNDKKDIQGIPRPQRTTSASSFGSLDGNTLYPNSGSLIDVVLETEQGPGTQQRSTSVFPSSHLSASTNSTNMDLFNLRSVQQPATAFAPPTDLFADINRQGSSTISSEKNLMTDPFSENVGWATFDLPHHVTPVSETNKGLPSVTITGVEAPKGSINALSSMHNSSQWFPEQVSASHGPSLVTADQWHAGLQKVERSDDPKSYQSWNAFYDSTGNVAQSSFGSLPPSSGTQVPDNKPPTFVDQFTTFKVPEVHYNNGFQKSTPIDRSSCLDTPLSGMAGFSFSSPVTPPKGAAVHEHISTNPFDLPYDSDTDANNLFLNMNSVQEALPKAELPTTSLSGLPQTWFSQSTLTPYGIPSVPQGDLAYGAGQVPSSQLQNIPAQGPVASLGGNPFA